MPRIEAIDPTRAEGKSRDLLDAVRAKLGMTPNLTRTMAHSPATLAGYLGLSGAVADGSLSPREREQIALAVSETNGCDYCLAAHAAVGKIVGLSELEIADARRGSATSSRENAILSFTRDLLDQRGAVTDESLARVRDAGVSEGEITEVVANLALHVFTNYLNRLAQTEVDFPAAPPLESAKAS